MFIEFCQLLKMHLFAKYRGT